MVSKKTSSLKMNHNGFKVRGDLFALEFIGSLFYLYLIYLIGANVMPVSTLLSTGSASFWLAVLPAVAVVAGVALFFHSFTYLFGGYNKISTLKLATVAGFAFFALTIGVAGGYFVVALIGFILTEVAAYMVHVEKDKE
ncbi:multipass membrane protein [Candidatus Mancarchaeum acidiphilum]|uniref:Multipass membrane protein n=1 Tax=Candidatus Mancarchaeum acidiphilum TaxID=1920749 RepID=A0A218NMY2_9ARCH|nr:hypothetical protein [Candidatus Mancarchaeum acidiphilum]ASI13806.1 multipass membrane protein [Candidatus Mancarchaeum acidiphilum]